MILCLVFFSIADAKQKGNYKKTLEEYTIPEVMLLDQYGRNTNIKDYLDADKPILIDFIFATCSTICPVLSASFAHFQKGLGENRDSVRFVSITIDPDHDTPEMLKDYLARYGAQEGWDVFTGRKEHVDLVLKALGAYVGNKMEHFPLIIMKAPGDNTWVRLNGLLSASDLKKEFETMVKQ